MSLNYVSRYLTGTAAALCAASLLGFPASAAEFPSSEGMSAADKLTLVLLDGNMFTGAQYKPGINFADGTYYYETVLQDDPGMTVLTNQSMSLTEDKLKELLGDRFEEDLDPEDVIPALISNTFDYDESTVITCEEGSKYSDKFSYPVYVCSWTQGNAENARQFIGMAVDTDDYLLLYTVDADADTYSEDPAFYNSMFDRLSVYDFTSEVPAVQTQNTSSHSTAGIAATGTPASAATAEETSVSGAVTDAAASNTADADTDASAANVADADTNASAANVTDADTDASAANIADAAVDTSALNIADEQTPAHGIYTAETNADLPFDPHAEGDASAYIGTWVYDSTHVLVTINEDATWTMEDVDGNILAEGTADLYAEGAVLNDENGNRVMVISGDTQAISTDKNGTSAMTQLFRQSDYYDYWSNPANGTDVQLYADGTWKIYEQGEVVNYDTAYLDDAGYHIEDAAGDEINCYVMDTINTLRNMYGYTLYRIGTTSYTSDDEILNHYDYSLPYAYTDNEGNVWYWDGNEEQYIGTGDEYFVEGGMYFKRQDFGDDESDIYDDVNSSAENSTEKNSAETNAEGAETADASKDAATDAAGN